MQWCLNMSDSVRWKTFITMAEFVSILLCTLCSHWLIQLWPLYFLMPYRFLQECIHSTGFHRIPLDSTRFWQKGPVWVLINTNICTWTDFCSLAVSLSLLRYVLPFFSQISHDTIIVVPSLTFLNMLKCYCLVLFSWWKMHKGQKKWVMRDILYIISPQWEHNANWFRKLQYRATTLVFGHSW